ncbi:AbrB family transcriptional regulator [Roseivivax sp. CAU 1753]
MRRDLRDAGTALAVGLLGAALFWLVGFPAAPLTGAATSVTVAGLLGVRVALPAFLRITAFILLGVGIGTGVTPEMIRTATAWPATISILAVSLLVGMAVARWGLERWMGFDRRSAVLAAAPGHLSYVLSLSLDSGGQTALIAVVQSIRVLFLTLCVPVFVARVFGATGAVLAPQIHMGPLPALLLIAGTYGLGLIFERIRLPAAFLLAGMALSAAGHATALTPGQLPAPVTFAAFLVMGVLIGSRFSGQDRDNLRAALGAGLWVTAVTMITTLLAVGGALVALGLPPALLIVAFAPGGVEAMAAISVTLGLDPAFVAAHHVTRLLILTVLIPLMMGRAQARPPG